MKLFSAFVLIVALIGCNAGGANADSVTGDGGLSPDGNTTTQVKHETTPPVASGSTHNNGGATPLASYVSYEVLGDGPAKAGDLSGLCFVGNDTSKPGFQYRIIGTAANGEVVEDRLVCVAFGPGREPPAPPPLPRLPTVEEAWAAAHLPDPVVTTDPAVRGITGLETRISTTGPTTMSVDASVSGYHMIATVHLDHYTIRVDGGPPVTADHDAYTFETKGNHTIEIAAVWRGEATLTGPDLIAPIHIDDIGTATLTTTRTYPVHEVRSVLQR
jgi:hypothetical protein